MLEIGLTISVVTIFLLAAWLWWRHYRGGARRVPDTYNQLKEAVTVGAHEVFSKHREALDNQAERNEQRLEKVVSRAGEQFDALKKEFTSIERERRQGQGETQELLKVVHDGQNMVAKEAATLSSALKNPTSAGQWGEEQLRRVIDAAGMIEHCHFDEQQSIEGEDGLQRPDVIVHLSGSRQVVIDAKAPTNHFLKAGRAEAEGDQDSKAQHLERFGRSILDHQKRLSSKAYWAQLDNSVDLVLMYVPNEAMWSAAFSSVPTLFEESAKSSVLPVSPMNLLFYLRSASHGWGEQKMAEHTKEVMKLSGDYYKRTAGFLQRYMALGKQINTVVGTYNKGAGSLKSRLVPSVKRLVEYGVKNGGKELEVPDELTEQAEVMSEELLQTNTLPTPSINGAGE